MEEAVTRTERKQGGVVNKARAKSPAAEVGARPYLTVASTLELGRTLLIIATRSSHLQAMLTREKA